MAMKDDRDSTRLKNLILARVQRVFPPPVFKCWAMYAVEFMGWRVRIMHIESGVEYAVALTDDDNDVEENLKWALVPTEHQLADAIVTTGYGRRLGNQYPSPQFGPPPVQPGSPVRYSHMMNTWLDPNLETVAALCNLVDCELGLRDRFSQSGDTMVEELYLHDMKTHRVLPLSMNMLEWPLQEWQQFITDYVSRRPR